MTEDDRARMQIDASHRARAEEDGFATFRGPGSSLGHFPKGERWEFDEGVARCCVDMMARSVPGYDEMRKLVHRLAIRCLPKNGALVELGAGDGESIAQLVRDRRDCRFYAVEHAPAMLAALRGRMKGL